MAQGSDLLPVVCLLVRRAPPKKSREPTLRFPAHAFARLARGNRPDSVHELRAFKRRS
jgi:hypothetical protein